MTINISGWRKSGMTKRDRLEGDFKLSLGMGKELAQSSSSESWKARCEVLTPA